MRQVTRDHFDDDHYDLWWRFLVERQRVWVRRAHLELPRPWTTDEAINGEFITNVYRELDPGTEYVLDAINSEDEQFIDVVFNIMIYRLMGSNITTHQMLGFMHHEGFSSKRFMRRLSEAAVTSRLFGDAYRVAGYAEYSSDTEGVSDKMTNISKLFKELATNLPEWYRRMETSPTARDLYNVFMNINGFGSFLSNQCMVDILMLDEMSDNRKWHFGTDSWTMAGPGARRGLRHMMNRKPPNLFACIRYLRDAQVEEFDSRMLRFPYLLNRDDSLKLLTVCNIQTALCEFGKYVRSRTISGTRRYLNTPSKLQPYDISLTDDEIEALSDISAVTPATNRLSLLSTPLEITSEALEEPQEVIEVEVVPDYTPEVVSRAPAAPSDGQFGAQIGQYLAELSLGRNSAVLPLLGRGQTESPRPKLSPLVIPVDPTGLLGLPKAILIIPLD